MVRRQVINENNEMETFYSIAEPLHRDLLYNHPKIQPLHLKHQTKTIEDQQQTQIVNDQMLGYLFEGFLRVKGVSIIVTSGYVILILYSQKLFLVLSDKLQPHLHHDG